MNMKSLIVKSVHDRSHLAPLIGLLFVCWLAQPAVAQFEFPQGCSKGNGGLGNTSAGGINFNQAQARAHVGDTVQVSPSLGMVNGACRATNVTGSIWIATGLMTNFMVNQTLDPSGLVTSEYTLLITPELVGAGVSSPMGSIPGVPKMVRVVENGNGTVLTGGMPETFMDFHSASISIVTPCIQVVQQCAYPPGTNCFPAGAPISFTGYVTNRGDIALTGVNLKGSRTPSLLDTNGLPLPQELFLFIPGSYGGACEAMGPGQAVHFQGSFTPTPAEVSAGIATNTITAWARDVTCCLQGICGPRASVTNQVTVACAICANQPPVIACASNKVVECGAAWDFDPPSASGGSNMVVSIVSTVTNANCGGSFTATRTWQAVGIASNTATCSQTVAVVDTTPPTVGCPAPITVEFQDENGAVVPCVVTASDTCSPVSLTVTPPCGSLFPIGTTHGPGHRHGCLQ